MTTRRYPARPGRLQASIAALLLALLAVSGCGTTSLSGLSNTSSEGRAARLAEKNDHAQSAGMYIGLAALASGSERDRLTLLAVEQWMQADDERRARNAFQTVSRPASGELLWLWSADSATLSLYDGRPDAALAILEPLTSQPMSLDNRIRIDGLHADAWFQKRDPGKAVNILLHLETLLVDRRQIAANQQRIWQGLLASSPDVLRQAAEQATDPVASGWLSLGTLAASTRRQGLAWNNGVQQWRQTHEGHPAGAFAKAAEDTNIAPLKSPQRIALLLPLSGRAASAGDAIQNGFLGAYFANAALLTERPAIRIYDVETEGGASAAYAQAVADGAQFVVGPLLKEEVIALANDILVPVPVMTLNYLPDDALPPPGLFQFALAPEDEAAEAAERAMHDGHRRAVALVPNNEWGQRLLQSFAMTLEQSGGTLLDYRTYTPGEADFSATIEQLMGLSGSVARYRRMRANLATGLQFDPRRRQDVDFIFIAADAASGRLLKSQLKFHYSGDLPTYATSSIFAMDTRSNADLNGVMFGDAPWVVAPQVALQDLPSLYDKYWPDERRLGRLQAMGHDAYLLVGSLYGGGGTEMREIDGASGRLYLDHEGRVHRRLTWARFESGKPQLLPDHAPALTPEDADIYDEGKTTANPTPGEGTPWPDTQHDPQKP